MVARRRMVALPKTPRGGSVEHFYHFVMSYFLPLDVFIDRAQPDSLIVRDCGPMNHWFDLLDPKTPIEIRPARQFLSDDMGNNLATVNVTSLEIRSWAQARAIRAARKRILLRHGFALTRPANTTLTLINRMPSLPFYAKEAEILTSGTERRSLPNVAELLQALGEVMPLREFEGEHLSPLEQVRQANETSVLVGQHGAGLANMVWMPSGGVVVEILPDTTVSKVARGHFRELARACGHSYRMVRQAGDHTPADVAAVLSAVGR